MFDLQEWLQQGAIIGKVGKWVEVFWGETQRHSTLAKASPPFLYQNTFFLETEKPWISFAHNKRWEWKEWKKLIKPLIKDVNFSEEELDWQEPDKKEFKRIFTLIQKEIKNKSIIKAVPVVYGKAIRKIPYADAILHALQQTPQNTFIYGKWDSEEGEFGFSPEILFLSEKPKKIKTMALAGTQKRESYVADPERFLSDPKEVKEHQIVVDDIVQRLQSLGKVQVSKTACLELDYLVHLYTPIQLNGLQTFTFDQLVEHLHPTPALGVSPRSQKELLRKWREPNDTLGAPFGIYWSENQFLSLVAIRHLRWTKEFFLVGNGCGVVAESQFEDEWYELKLKRESVKRVFKI